MPSEAARKRQAQKKEKRQASSRSAQKRTQPQATPSENGDVVQNGSGAGISDGASASVSEVSGRVERIKVSPRSCTGVLVSHPSSRDVHIHNFSLTFHGAELLSDTHLELNTGRRYGLLGLNGSGK